MIDLEILSGWLKQDERLSFEGLELLPPKGLAHDHVRLTGSGLLLRIPKQSQRGYAPLDNLTYQAACFERVQRSGHGPGLALVLPPSQALPMGALLVEEIYGRPLSLPGDLPLLAQAMAAVHCQDLPAPDQRAPLEDHRDPVAGLYQEILDQAELLPQADLLPASLALLKEELAWAEAFQQDYQQWSGPQPQRLVLTDTHPGNFLVAGKGALAAGNSEGLDPASPSGGLSTRDDRPCHAVIVDLEKALYGSPATDLAHATVYSSTTWDLEATAVLSQEDVGTFYRHYLSLLPDDLARDLRPWLLPLRRLLWLRAMTWCAFWQVNHRKAAKDEAERALSAQDWSADKTDSKLIAHVAERVTHYLSPDILKLMQQDWAATDGLEAHF
ncbi:aminoglycoside phosphotransferase [Rhodovibrionaceae bacterium A322]